MHLLGIRNRPLGPVPPLNSAGFLTGQSEGTNPHHPAEVSWDLKAPDPCSKPDLTDLAPCSEAGSPAGPGLREAHKDSKQLSPIDSLHLSDPCLRGGGMRKAHYRLTHFALNQLLNALG